MENIGGSVDIAYRYQRPRVETKVLGKKLKRTVITNLENIAQAERRPAITILKYLSYALNTGVLHNDSLKGIYSVSDLEAKLLEFELCMVCCQVCTNPETQFKASKSKDYVKLLCAACGSRSQSPLPSKFCQYLRTTLKKQK